MNAAGNPGSKDNGVVIATAERSLGHITELLARHRIGCVVIVENEDKVCGIVSEHDVMRAVGKAGQQALSRPVSDFMTTDVVTANKADTNRRLLAEMATHQFRHMPVVDKGKLVGIVSIGDLVQEYLENAEAESDALRKHISSA
ncbi:MAG: CBS domain-containing protein [Candidatus Promineifilaceae bacterium]|jgi:CBS domain-containing protein